jgi:hypothetical protein
MAKSKGKPADRATPAIHKSTSTDVQKVDVTREVTQTAKASQGWATAPALQAAVTVWNNAADVIDANRSVITDLGSKLRLAQAKQLVARRAWNAARKQVLGTLDVQCAGSADDVKAFGFDAVVRTTPAGPLAPPDPVVVSPGKLSGEVIVSWPKNATRHGYLVQYATDAANAASYSEVIASTGAKKTLKGLAPGAHVFVHVAAVDPTEASGRSAWTAWVAATAR